MLFDGIEWHQKIGSFYFSLIGNMNIDENEIFSIHHFDELINVNVLVTFFAHSAAIRCEISHSCRYNHQHQEADTNNIFYRLIAPFLKFWILVPSLYLPSAVFGVEVSHLFFVDYIRQTVCQKKQKIKIMIKRPLRTGDGLYHAADHA